MVVISAIVILGFLSVVVVIAVVVVIIVVEAGRDVVNFSTPGLFGLARSEYGVYPLGKTLLPALVGSLPVL